MKNLIVITILIVALSLQILAMVNGFEIHPIYLAVIFLLIVANFLNIRISRKKEIVLDTTESEEPKLKDLVPGDIIMIEFGYVLTKVEVIYNFPNKKDIYLKINGIGEKLISYSSYNFNHYKFIKHKSC